VDKQYEERIRAIIEERKHANGQWMRRKSKVYRAFEDMEQHAFSSGALDRKVKELIALGISVVINCESCMEWHIRQALDSDATEEQIVEAIEVGIEMGGGPATVASRFALRALEYHLGAQKNPTQDQPPTPS